MAAESCHLSPEASAGSRRANAAISAGLQLPGPALLTAHDRDRVRPLSREPGRTSSRSLAPFYGIFQRLASTHLIPVISRE